MLISLKYMSSLQKQLPDLAESATGETWEQKLLARRGIIYVGLGIFALAFLFGVLAENQLKERVVVGAFPSVEELRANWPGFRGPQGQGVAYVKNAPTT